MCSSRKMLLLLALSAVAAPARATDAVVDLRAVGDSAFIAGNALFGTPPDGWVESHLKGLEPLRSPDVNFLNLEGAVSRSCRRFFEKEFMFAVAPEALVQFGRWGFNMMGLANNHSQDCLDPSSASESPRAQDLVRAAVPGVALHGVAANAAALAAPAILTVKGLRIGFVAMKAWPGGKADNMGNFDNRHELLRALRDADVDIRVLSLHGGTESARRPHETLIELSREFIARYGGDVVFAHHPHVMQGMELLRKPDGRAAAVFYSLGNFLHDGLSDKGDGYMAKLEVSKAGVDPDSVVAFPLANANTYPAPVAKADLGTALAILRSSSAVAQTRGLPPGLTRVPFTLAPTTQPVPGLRLVTGDGAAAEPGAVKAPAKVGKGGKASLARPQRTSRWAPPQLPPARWIPPQKD